MNKNKARIQVVSPIPQNDNSPQQSNIPLQVPAAPSSPQVTLIEADTSTTIPKTPVQGIFLYGFSAILFVLRGNLNE